MSNEKSTRLFAVSAVCLLIAGLAAGVDASLETGQPVHVVSISKDGKTNWIQRGSGEPAQLLSDGWIKSSIDRALANDPNLGTLQIEVATQHGRVALRGTVPNPVFKARATVLAEVVRGVVAVDNNLVVLLK